VFVEALRAIIGATIAILLDWAIYTHLGAYLRVGLPSTPRSSYRDLAVGSSTAVIRTITVFAVGLAGGLAFALGSGPLWLVVVGAFVVLHSLLYVSLYRPR
jgi:hypothetical protein